MKVKTSMVKPVLETMEPCKKYMVPMFIGAPGIGKTQGINEYARENGKKVVTFILSNTVPSEVSGIRMPDTESKKLEVFDDSRMASLEDGDILFFDEILEAPPMLWSACLTLIQDRIMASGRKLPDVFIVAASNEVASPGIIPASVRDRFQIIELEFDREYWCQWFNEAYGVYPEKISQRIKADSDQYNILTPRRVTKLYNWLKNDESNDEARKVKQKIIGAMFDAVTCEEIIQLVYGNKSAQEQIRDALGAVGIHTKMDDVMSEMSLKDVMSFLQDQPEWEEMREVLATTSFEEQDIKVIY